MADLGSYDSQCAVWAIQVWLGRLSKEDAHAKASALAKKMEIGPSVADSHGMHRIERAQPFFDERKETALETMLHG